jgi:prepilin-type N-terminal cleavage/methylation domain-containing protein
MKNVRHKATGRRATKASNPRPRSARPSIPTAFTLIEMLVVLLIFAIAVALVHGVGSTVQEDARAAETRNIQAVVLKALEAYHGGDHKSRPSYPEGNGDLASNARLVRLLQANPKANKILWSLPGNAVDERNGTRYLLDGFGAPMEYYGAEGVDKTPKLVSHGPNPDDPTDDMEVDMSRMDRRPLGSGERKKRKAENGPARRSLSEGGKLEAEIDNRKRKAESWKRKHKK